MGKKVLFSEGHGESVRFQKSLMANIIRFVSRTSNPFESLEQILLRFKYSFHYSEDRKLSLQFLRNYDILFILKPTKPFLPKEITAIEKFVRLGGSVLLIGQYSLQPINLMPANLLSIFKGNWKSYEYMNNISRKFGIFFISAPIEPGKDRFSTQTTNYLIPAITDFETHPIFQKIENFYYQGCAIEITREASPLAYSAKDTKPPNALVMAFSEFGDGRVFTTGSSLIFTDHRLNNLGIRNPQHAKLALNIFTWLAHESPIKKNQFEPPTEKVCPFCEQKNPNSEIFCRACGNSI